MKTPEELNALKNEVETMNKKLPALSDEELSQVNGGAWSDIEPDRRISDLRRYLNANENFDKRMIGQYVRLIEDYDWIQDAFVQFLDSNLRYHIIDQTTYDGMMTILFSERYYVDDYGKLR